MDTPTNQPTDRDTAARDLHEVENPISAIEFETMLLSRYILNPRYHNITGLLDRSAYLLLNRLELEGPLSVRELSQALSLDYSTLSRQVNSLLKHGFVTRIADPDNGLARKIHTTAEGRRRLESVRASNIASIDRVLADWTPTDVAAFAHYLSRFNRTLEARSGTPWPRPLEEQRKGPDQLFG